jgi:hypothetical protein
MTCSNFPRYDSLSTTTHRLKPSSTPIASAPYTSVLSRGGPLYEQEPAVASRLIASSRTKNLVPIKTNIKGTELLNTPRLNKGAAFTREERAIFGLEGMIPYEIHDLQKQYVLTVI